jgi:hypothetical protein
MRMRFIAVGLAAGLLFVGSAVAGAKTVHHSCGSIGGEYLKIQATNTTCVVAKQKVIFYEMQGENPPGWKCTFKPKGRNSDVSCKHRGGELVTYVFHS